MSRATQEKRPDPLRYSSAPTRVEGDLAVVDEDAGAQLVALIANEERELLDRLARE